MSGVLDNEDARKGSDAEGSWRGRQQRDRTRPLSEKQVDSYRA